MESEAQAPFQPNRTSSQQEDLPVHPKSFWEAWWLEYEKLQTKELEGYFAPLTDTSANLRFDGAKVRERMGDCYDEVKRQDGINVNEPSYAERFHDEKMVFLEIIARRCVYIAEFAHKHELQRLPEGKDLIDLNLEPQLFIDKGLFHSGILKAAEDFEYSKDILVWMYGFDKRELDWLERNPRKEEFTEQWSTLEKFHRLQSQLGRDICEDLIEQLRFTFYAVRDSRKPWSQNRSQHKAVARLNPTTPADARRREFKIARIMADRIERDCLRNGGQRTSKIVMRGISGDWKSLRLEDKHRLLGAATEDHPEHEWYHEMVTTYSYDLNTQSQQMWHRESGLLQAQFSQRLGQPASGHLGHTQSNGGLAGLLGQERIRYPPGILPNLSKMWNSPSDATGSVSGFTSALTRVPTAKRHKGHLRQWTIDQSNRGQESTYLPSFAGSQQIPDTYRQAGTCERMLRKREDDPWPSHPYENAISWASQKRKPMPEAYKPGSWRKSPASGLPRPYRPSPLGHSDNVQSQPDQHASKSSHEGSAGIKQENLTRILETMDEPSELESAQMKPDQEI